MLKQRVLTAVVLLALLLPALAVEAVWPFALLSLVFIAAAGWEWARLNGLGGTAALGYGAVLALACCAALAAGWAAEAPSWVWWVALLVWVPGGIWGLRAGPSGWPRLSVGARLVIGLVALWVAWLAFTHAKVLGINFLLSILCLVWAADIAAYFGGKAFGRRKLAPSISPGKSWEGVWSGVLGVVVLAALWIGLDAQLDGASLSLYSELAMRIGWIGLAVALAFLTGMSVVGDLMESLVKRSAGAKDSSRLLPGHGGVLDRIDALLPVVPLALALSTL